MSFYNRKAFFIAFALSVLGWILLTYFDYFLLHKGEIPYHTLLFASVSGYELAIRISVVMFFIFFCLIISYYMNNLESSETRLNNIFNNVIPICITNNDYQIVSANNSYRDIFGSITDNGQPIMCHDSRPGPKCKTEECPLYQISQLAKDIYTCESTKIENGITHNFIVTATPLFDRDGKQSGIIETFQDITQRKKLEEEKELLINKLQDALGRVKLLSGLIPICASCKKIRDDKGYWTQIESYIRTHSEAEFSHGICPECAEKLYGEFSRQTTIENERNSPGPKKPKP